MSLFAPHDRCDRLIDALREELRAERAAHAETRKALVALTDLRAQAVLQHQPRQPRPPVKDTARGPFEAMAEIPLGVGAFGKLPRTQQELEDLFERGRAGVIEAAPPKPE